MKDNSLQQKLIDLKEGETLDSVKQELEAGTDPMNILDVLRDGMIAVGNRYEKGEYFLPELIMAGEIFKQASGLLFPNNAGSGTGSKGAVVFGTVQGDIHDIGKNLVTAILRAVGYDVHDLGVNVPPEKFVEKIRETGAKVLGLSGLITTAYDGMKDTVKALTDAGLRNDIKIMIGGGIMDESVQAYTGADANGQNPNEAVKLCQQFMGGK